MGEPPQEPPGCAPMRPHGDQLFGCNLFAGPIQRWDRPTVRPSQGAGGAGVTPKESEPWAACPTLPPNTPQDPPGSRSCVCTTGTPNGHRAHIQTAEMRDEREFVSKSRFVIRQCQNCKERELISFHISFAKFIFLAGKSFLRVLKGYQKGWSVETIDQTAPPVGSKYSAKESAHRFTLLANKNA